MMTHAGKNRVLPSSLVKFNVRDAGTLIGLLIIIVTFFFFISGISHTAEFT